MEVTKRRRDGRRASLWAIAPWLLVDEVADNG
jgi:hypothetical protein